MRVILILLNAIMFLVGVPEIELPLELKTVYDIPIAIIAVVLGILYIVGSIKDAVELAKLGQ